jgi:hypothetical protein
MALLDRFIAPTEGAGLPTPTMEPGVLFRIMRIGYVGASTDPETAAEKPGYPRTRP